MKTTAAVVLFSIAFCSTAFSQIRTPVEGTIINCRSNQAADAGYSVEVMYDHGAYLAFVSTVTITGKGRKLFSGDVIAKVNPASSPHRCYIDFADFPRASDQTFAVRVASYGEARIFKLHGSPVPRNGLSQMTCQVSAQALFYLGCPNYPPVLEP